MDKVSQRIQSKSHLIRTFAKKHWPKYAHWNMPRDELEVNLLVALWRTIEYRDQHPDDPKSEYQRFYNIARSYLGDLVRSRGYSTAARVREAFAGSVVDSTEDFIMEQGSDDGSNPADLCEMVELLGALTPKQQAVLGALSVIGDGGNAEIAQVIGLKDSRAVDTQMIHIRKAITTGEPPLLVGLTAQVAETLGVSNRKAERVLVQARKELGITVELGSRYNHIQQRQIMRWVRSCQANNPVESSMPIAQSFDIPRAGPALMQVARSSPPARTGTVAAMTRTSQSVRPPLKS